MNLVLLFHNTNAGLAKGIPGTILKTAHKINDVPHKVFYHKEDTNKRRLYREVNNIECEQIEDTYYTTRMHQVMTRETKTESTLGLFDDTNSDGNPGPLTNYEGGCTPGTQRTEDGRCMVEFSKSYGRGGYDETFSNYKGGCAKGTQQTEDGRCMVQF